MDSVKQKMGQLAVAVGEAARKRVLWEQARDEGSPDTFMRAKAHRDAESAAADLTQEVIELYAKQIRAGIPLGGTPEAV
jgi:hypothetical protein